MGGPTDMDMMTYGAMEVIRLPMVSVAHSIKLCSLRSVRTPPMSLTILDELKSCQHDRRWRSACP